MSTVLITGSAGFVGSHLVQHVLNVTDWTVIGLDSFRHAGDSMRISSSNLSSGRYQIYTCDLAVPVSSKLLARLSDIDIIVNLASVSSVDLSLADPGMVVRNNITLMESVLEIARKVAPRLLLQMSTDEVYGPALKGEKFAEWSPIKPSNPYSASKAAQEVIAYSYWRSFDIPLMIANSPNIIGEKQDVEKFIPRTIKAVLAGAEVDIHCHNSVPGSRTYLYAGDLASALVHLITRFESGAIGSEIGSNPLRYNIPGASEVDNLFLARRVATLLGKNLLYRNVEALEPRPGYDFRYGLDASKLTATGWKPRTSFDEALERTVIWYEQNPDWLD